MALSDRLRRLAGRAGSALSSYSSTAPRIDGIGIARQAPYPPATPQQERIATSTEALRGRISYGAGPQHTRYSTYPAVGLSPQTVQSILRDADLGIVYRWADLNEQVLERDGHLRSVDRGRRVEVSGKPFRVAPVTDTPIAQVLAKFVRAVVDQIDSFERSVYSMLGANAVGFSLSEIVWEQGKVRFPGVDGVPVTVDGLFPRQLDWVHPKHLVFDRDTDEPMLNIGSGGALSFPKHKFVFHGSAGDGFFERRGYMRSVIWLHLFKQHCIRDWAIFGSLFGIPNIVARYPRGVIEPTEARAIYETLLTDFGQGKPIIAPDDIDVTVTPGPAGTGNAAQQGMIGWCNAEISKAVQGETLTTELSQTGSYNIGDVHADTKHAIIRDDARGLAGDLRSDLFKSIVELNLDALARLTGASPEDVRAAVPVPSWRIERETSPLQRAQIIVALAGIGLKMSPDQVYEEFGFDPPPPETDPLPGAPVQVADGGKVVGAVEAGAGVDNPKDAPPSPSESAGEKKD